MVNWMDIGRLHGYPWGSSGGHSSQSDSSERQSCLFFLNYFEVLLKNTLNFYYKLDFSKIWTINVKQSLPKNKTFVQYAL